MLFMEMLGLLWLMLAAPTYSYPGPDKSYTNPILPGWNSDPSCTFVKELDNTFFCTTSSFLAFPGVPVYASKDLVNWRLASNALTRPEQLPELSFKGQQSEGIWASTIRYHEGVLYLITSYVTWSPWGPKILLFRTTDPYDDSAWEGPLRVENPGNDIDPDLFWDKNGKTYMSVAAGIYISEVDLETGAAKEPIKVWNGTGDRNPEGPHIYTKDGYYYLLIGEGGTETNHSVTIARSKSIEGPYEGNPANPILTAKNTDEYFQTVGHADLFQDASGNWWAVALATRSGPEWEIYPMGRESVLVPAVGEREVACSRNGTRKNVWTLAKEEYQDSRPGSSLPKHFSFWRPPKTSLFEVSPRGHANSLRISPSRVNLTADEDFDTKEDGLAFVFRKQSSTIFSYSVDVSFEPKEADEEAGITVFLTQFQHIDLGIVNLAKGKGKAVPTLRFQVEASGKPGEPVPKTKEVAIPKSWLGKPIRLTARAKSSTTYVLSAALASNPKSEKVLGEANASIVSGGSGPFTGTVVGAYATSNGGKGKTPAYFSRWRYTSLAQEIAEGEIIPV
ncbi:xylosidase : arabinofuranosidase [Fusarium albosuccineum]|uniref:Xylosidase: arabinofuranosidase n=1 Tax=Fusarium albosuccineum TaxID=1237068 RepID=A0A8H4LPA7_9HYPO|nr:xylosidase : arabinofuranosidase [Fusarium albosuccineum]